MVGRYLHSVLRKAGCLAALLVGVVAAPPAHAVQLVKVGSFSAPTYVTAPAGDASRLFITQQGGKIVLMVGGVKQATPFLDITSKVKQPNGTEQGLLSMAFPPTTRLAASSTSITRAATVPRPPAATNT